MPLTQAETEELVRVLVTREPPQQLPQVDDDG